MTNPKMDIIKSDPTEFAKKVSTISLTSGSLFGAAVVLGVIEINTDKWVIDPWLLRIGLIGAALLALASTGAHALDLIVRGVLAGLLIRTKGTSDPNAAKKLPIASSDIGKLVDKLVDKEMIHGVYLVQPGQFKSRADAPPIPPD